MNIQTRALRRAQSGLSIVELMVGVAIGLIIVAAAATLVATQLTENRRLMLETQVQQDLRATADIIARELRRAGYQEESESLAGVWLADRPGDLPRANSLAALTFPSGVPAVDFKYFRSFGNTSFGFKQVGSVVKTFLGGNAAGSFQDLTDPNAVVISAFSVNQSASTMII